MKSTKRCPYCAEEVPAVSIKCKHCGSHISSTAAIRAKPSAAAGPPDLIGKIPRCWDKCFARTRAVHYISLPSDLHVTETSYRPPRKVRETRIAALRAELEASIDETMGRTRKPELIDAIIGVT